MAEAEQIQVAQTTYVPGIRLTLTLEEAKLVYAVMQRVGGDTVTSPRKFADRISDALNQALPEFKWRGIEYREYTRRLDGDLFFDEEE